VRACVYKLLRRGTIVSMPASIEALLEEIVSVERALSSSQASGDRAEAQRLTEVVADLRARLARANEALQPGRQILKG